MAIKEAKLAEIVGPENVIDDLKILETYSRDHSFVVPQKPRFVVQPKSADEVQGVVRWANQTHTPLVPVSSGSPRFRGDTVPSVPGAIVVDLSRMKRIIRIDRRNRVTIVEPGVTFEQLQPELAKQGLKLSMSLAPRKSKSVLTSFLEREPTLVPKYHWEMTEPLRCAEVVWGSGDRLITGEAGAHGTLEDQWERRLAQVCGMGPYQVDYYRLFSAAQGTMGIVTWVSLKCEVLPRVHKLFFVCSQELGRMLGFTYRLFRLRCCDELLFLNNSNLASLLGEGADQIKALRDQLPQWILILGVTGRDRLPEEKVEYQVNDINDLAQQSGVKLVSAIPGASDGEVLKALLKPSKEPYWKLRYKGGYQDIFFLTTLDRTTEFVNTIYSLAQEKGYLSSDIGVYLQPVMQGVACHCEFSLPYDPNNQGEVSKIQGLLAEGSVALMNQGAFFSRPYGIWAGMTYNRDTQATTVLEKIKGIFDPNKVMNPGKLCF